MIIRKYKLTSQLSEEHEFEVTFVRKTINTEYRTTITDDNGNVLSARAKQGFTRDKQIDDGIQALSLPSRTPAIVEIIKTEEVDLSPSVPMEDLTVPDNRPKSVKIDELNRAGDRSDTVVDLDKLLHQDGQQPTKIPKNDEITWADGSH